jgi:hypothetical protein
MGNSVDMILNVMSCYKELHGKKWNYSDVTI